MLLTVKYFEVLPKHNGYAFDSEFFRVLLHEQIKIFYFQCKLKQNFFCCSLKLIMDSTFEVNVVSSDPLLVALPNIFLSTISKHRVVGSNPTQANFL